MKRYRKHRKQCYLVYPYLFHLVLLGLLGVLFCSSMTVFFLYDQNAYNSFMEYLSKRWLLIVVVLLPSIVYLAVCFINAYEFWGVITFGDSELRCNALFKKPLTYKYAAIQDIGVGYVWLSIGKVFFIYLCNERITNKSYQQIYRLPVKSGFIKIQ